MIPNRTRTLTTDIPSSVSIGSASGDARHDHDLLSLRIEAVETLRRSPGPHLEGRRASGTVLGEDPLGFLNGGHRLRVALLDASDIPLVRGVAMLGQDPQYGHELTHLSLGVSRAGNAVRPSSRCHGDVDGDVRERASYVVPG